MNRVDWFFAIALSLLLFALGLSLGVRWEKAVENERVAAKEFEQWRMITTKQIEMESSERIKLASRLYEYIDFKISKVVTVPPMEQPK